MASAQLRDPSGAEKGTVELKGLDGTWRLHRVRREAGPAPS